MTFGLLYAFTENFILPLSHDEVVYGKKSLIGKMPGDRWQRFANLRAYFGFMWSSSRQEIAIHGRGICTGTEWSHDREELDWPSLNDPLHAGFQRLIHDLNRLYVSESALHVRDCQPSGFQWVIGDDHSNSVFSFLRLSDQARVLVVLQHVARAAAPLPDRRRVAGPLAGNFQLRFDFLRRFERR